MEERVALNEVEPFDEWEEFALFASHYFLLVATKHLDANSTYGYIGPDQRHLDVRPVVHDTLDVVQKPQAFLTFRYVENPRERGRRRFGAAVQTAAKLVGHHGGLGPQTRLNSTDVYTDGEIDDLIWNSPPVSIAARMCHTITPLNNEDCLLVGGRTSPGNALADCWVRRSQSWERIDDLPSPRYRHCAALVSLEKEDPSVLICGGKNSAGTVLEDYLIWRSEYGWQTVQVNGVAPKPRFGASVITGIETSGVLVGGMTEDGIILSECWHWFIENHSGIITISFHNPWQSNAGPSGSDCLMARFGASLLWSSVGLLYIGGISRRGLTPQEYEVMLVYPEIRTKSASQTERRRANHFEKVDLVFDGPRPLLVGHTVANVEAGELLILGGGAVCFSFGTYWNLGTWTVHTSSDLSRPPWHLREAAEAVPSLRSTVPDECQLNGDVDSNPSVPHLTAIDRVRVASARAFAAIVMEGRPTVLEGLNIGSCTKVWDVDYLRKRVGASRQVCSKCFTIIWTPEPTQTGRCARGCDRSYGLPREELLVCNEKSWGFP